MSSTSVELRFPTTEFRSLPIPNTNTLRRAKIATCFARVTDLPIELGDWMAVNPRVPKFNKKEELQGPVAKAMIRTLQEEPEKFALKNQGIYLLVKEVEFKKQEGGQGFVHITLENPDFHGLVNGGHTYRAIRQVIAEREDNGEDGSQPDEAYVRLHIMEGVDEDLITDLAEGLNRSMQVDNPSLENLRGRFDEIKRHLKGKTGENQISYRQGDTGDVEIVQVLTLMGLFDLNRFPDRKTHPNVLFGHPKEVLQNFIEDSGREPSVFRRILPKLHEILILSDLIQQLGVEVPELARIKVSSSKKENRVRSRKHKGRPAHFAGGTIDGYFPLGWLYPMLAAFRANISPAEWENGEIQWVMEPKELLEQVIDEMARIIRQEHEDNKGKPAEVGKREAAYRACYGVVTMELAQRGLLPRT